MVYKSKLENRPCAWNISGEEVCSVHASKILRITGSELYALSSFVTSQCTSSHGFRVDVCSPDSLLGLMREVFCLWATGGRQDDVGGDVGITTNFVANQERQRGRRLDWIWMRVRILDLAGVFVMMIMMMILGRCFACRRQADAKTRRVFTNFLNLQRTLSLNRRRPKIHQKFWTHKNKKKLAQHVAWCSFSNDRSWNALPNEVDSFQASIVPVAHVRMSVGSPVGLEWNLSDYFRPNIWQDLSNEAKDVFVDF